MAYRYVAPGRLAFSVWSKQSMLLCPASDCPVTKAMQIRIAGFCGWPAFQNLLHLTEHLLSYIQLDLSVFCPANPVLQTLSCSDPALLDALLSHLADAMSEYIMYQINSGAQCVQISTAGAGSCRRSSGTGAPRLRPRCSRARVRSLHWHASWAGHARPQLLTHTPIPDTSHTP